MLLNILHQGFLQNYISLPGLGKRLFYRKLSLFLMLLFFIGNSDAKGINPERNNQITICTDSLIRHPTFTLIFSISSLVKTVSLNNGRITNEQLTHLREGKEFVVLDVGGKDARQGQTCYDYFFGTKNDGNQPWNNGKVLHWQQWANFSDDVWDNLAIVYRVSGEVGAEHDVITITNVVIKRGGLLLFDSRARSSIPNSNPIDVQFAPIGMHDDGGLYSVVDLGEAMKQFKRLYYELNNNPVLLTAYDDLGQTDSSKYSASPEWCSEFVSYVYRVNGIHSPDLNVGEINWRTVKSYFREFGKIYDLREVALWSQHDRIDRIPPGSLVSIVTDNGTAHILLLTKWVMNDKAGKFSAISGNNHGMVWHHKPISLESLLNNQRLLRMSSSELNSYYEKSFVVVPVGFQQ